MKWPKSKSQVKLASADFPDKPVRIRQPHELLNPPETTSEDSPSPSSLTQQSKKMDIRDSEENFLNVAERGDFDKLREMLNKGNDPNIMGDSGWTPLHNVAKKGYLELAEVLLDYGADPNAKENTGLTPLHLATQSGLDVMVQLLLEYWADPNAKDKLDSTPLHIAARGRNPLVAKLLLDSGADRNASNKSGNTPLHDVEDEIAPMFSDMKVSYARKVMMRYKYLVFDCTVGIAGANQSLQDAKIPVFPIIINGNTFDESTKRAEDASTTNYVLVQTLGSLSPSQMQQLETEGLKHFDYVSKNTYLCYYQPQDLDKIRRMELIVYADIYHTAFKTVPNLKEPVSDRDCRVDVIFHTGVQSGSIELKNHILHISKPRIDHIDVSPHKVRLAISGQYIRDIAELDEVRCIDKVYTLVACSNKARVIIGADKFANLSPGHKQTYEGKGQVIAIADEGFDIGRIESVHPAFTDRIEELVPLPNPPPENRGLADPSGHATHLCGLAAGDGRTRSGKHIRGTAPQAQLVVQCAGHYYSGIPVNLADLFGPPYRDNRVRVHCDAWGEVNDDLCKFFMDKRKGHVWNPRYSDGAEMIDKLVQNQLDMVICFAAGNDGSDPTLSKVHIWAEAAAKNCITVGASENDRPVPDYPEYTYYDYLPECFPEKPLGSMHIASDISRVAAFSSHGPTSDGRVKPDIVAPGTYILSAKPRSMTKDHDAGVNDAKGDDNTEAGYDARSDEIAPKPHPKYDEEEWCLSGTSHATALVAGCAAVLRETLAHSGLEPINASLIKGLLINGADILPERTHISVDQTPRYIPSNNSGFGRVNLANSIMVALGENSGSFYERILNEPDKTEFSFPIAIEAPYATLRATLAWSDLPGQGIQNRLLLELKCKGETKRPARINNNVQQVVWNNPPLGEITAVVGRIGRLRKSPQPFAVIFRFTRA